MSAGLTCKSAIAASHGAPDGVAIHVNLGLHMKSRANRVAQYAAQLRRYGCGTNPGVPAVERTQALRTK